MSMLGLIGVELLKMRTVRGPWVTGALTLLVSGGLTLIALATADDVRGGLTQLADIRAAGYTGAAGALAAVASLGDEYGHRTIATTLTLVPHRGRVVAAKAVAGGLIGLVLSLAAAALALAITALWLRSEGLALPLSGAEGARVLAGNAVVGLACGLGAVGIAGLVRSTAGASMLLGFAYLGLSDLLGALVGFWGDYGLGAAQSAAVDPAGAHALAYGPALAVNLAFGLLLLGAGAATVRRADV